MGFDIDSIMSNYQRSLVEQEYYRTCVQPFPSVIPHQKAEEKELTKLLLLEES